MNYTKIYNKFNKFLLYILPFSVMLAFCGCDSTSFSGDANPSEIVILCTGFSQYDWASNIVGDTSGIKIETLFKNGIDTHNYQPTAEDIIKISNCDLIIYTGGESDKPITDIINSLGDNKPVIINMMEELKDSLLCVGEAHPNIEYTHMALSEYDEHIWLSLKNAQTLCRIISDNIIALDQDNLEIYNQNTTEYISKLSDLDYKYAQMIDNSIRQEIIFADKYPFAYLANDYNLTCFSAFPGCSAETDASFETILSLASKIDDLKLTSVITIDGGSTNIDEAVIANSRSTDIKTLSLNSLQSVSEDEFRAGLTYLSAMEDNFNIIKESLN